MSLSREITKSAWCDGCIPINTTLEYEDRKDLITQITLKGWTREHGEHYCWACSLERELKKLPRKKWYIVTGITQSGTRKEIMIDEVLSSIHWHLGPERAAWQGNQAQIARDNGSKREDYCFTEFELSTSNDHPWDREEEE